MGYVLLLLFAASSHPRAPKRLRRVRDGRLVHWDGKLSFAEINQTYPLKDAAQAHRDLESRKTIGSTVFIV